MAGLPLAPRSIGSNRFNRLRAGPATGMRLERSPPLKPTNFIHHDFVQFRKQYLRYKVILSFIVLSKQCCEVYFIHLKVTKPL